MLRAKIYARALRASQNVERAAVWVGDARKNKNILTENTQTHEGKSTNKSRTRTRTNTNPNGT
jgi:hypothetical protein